MTSLIKETLAEWTEGLDTRQSMISVFTHIRDIPYSVSSVPMSNPLTSAEQLLKAGKGSCGPKHYLLAEMFRKLNLNVVYATIAFSWNDPDLHYPSDLRKLAARLPLAYHLACRVQIGCRWVLVDATWDPPLVRGGFLINGPWDGYSELKWAVKPFMSTEQPVTCLPIYNETCRVKDLAEPIEGEKDHWNADDHVRYYDKKGTLSSPEQVMWKVQFYKKFEDWLVDLRKMQNQISD